MNTTQTWPPDPNAPQPLAAHEPVPQPEDFQVPRCSLCRRERTAGGAEHPMDAYEYSALQAINGQPFGWYSGPDGEVCPEDMERTVRGQQ